MDSIASFAPFPYYGGLQEFAVELACRLHIPLILVGEHNSMPDEIKLRLERSQVEVFWIPSEGFFLRNPILVRPTLYKQVNRIMKQFSLIHFHGPFPLVGDIVLNNVNFVFTYHYDIMLKNRLTNSIGKIYTSSLLLRTLKLAKIITVSSNYFARESPIIRKFIHKVKILPLGVDTTKLVPSFRYSTRIIFIGRIIPEKGIHILIRAFEIFSRKAPDYELIIIGSPVDMSYWKSLLDYVKRHDLSNKVIFTDFLPRDEVIRLLSEASVLTLPSLSMLESFGIVLLEASALAIPVIATSIIPGAKELVERAHNGVIVSPNNAEELALAIEKIVENPKVYGIGGREYVIKHHDWSVVESKARQMLKTALEY